MFIWTFNGSRYLRRVGVIAGLSLLTMLFSSLGGFSLLRAAAEGDEKPLTRAATTANRVALTFDVTWGQDELNKILAVLEAKQVKATFFVGGTFLSSHPEVVKQIAAKGHEIGTLGQMIVNLSALPEQEVTSNLLASQSALSKTLGGPVRYFRPPQGDATPVVVRAARSAQLVTVTHSLDAQDYLQRRATDITDRVVKQASKGEIIHLTASDFAKETARALPGLIEGLQRRGFEIVPVSGLTP